MNKVNIAKKCMKLFIMTLMTFLLVSCNESKNMSNEVASETLNVNESKEESSEILKETNNNQGGVRPSGEGNNRPNGGGGIDKSDDETLQSLIESEVPKFKQFSYTDDASGITVNYNLFIPENYDSNKKYPMVQFIPDASLFGKDTLSQLTQGYGGLVWTTEEAQKKNECFVYVPAFSGGLSHDYKTVQSRMESVVDDDNNVSEDVFINLDVIKDICKNYSIDTDRIYTTGQSMGGILSFFYATYFNDIFAAYMPVGSQFDNNMVKRLKDRNIIYLVSEGDTKASEGMSKLKNLLDEENTKYSYRYFSIKDTYENQNKIVKEAVSEGNNYNLFMFKKGEVVPAGVQSNNEHMYSFDYAYKIDAAREYLFTKTKNNNNQQVNFANAGKKKLEEGKNEEALELFLDGCVASDKKAPRYVGYMYENGLSLPQNDIQASIFYHIGTLRDDITSYYYLGLMYLQGKGVNQNTERAKEYFEKAANSGNENATGVKEAKEELEKLK